MVICIPSLDTSEARAAIESLATLFVSRKRVAREELLRTIGEMKVRIGKYASSGSKDPALAQELPLDLCVYLNDEWDGSIAQ